MRAAVLAMFCGACASAELSSPDAGPTAPADAAALEDAAPVADALVFADAQAIADAASLQDASAPADASTGPPRCATRSIDAPPLTPQPGELFLAHLGLEGISLGESTLVQLPDGSRALIDVGNDSHADDIVRAVDALFGSRTIALVVLTHHHADHEDGLEDLLDDLSIQTVIHRGMTDLTPAANDATMGRICANRARFTEIELCTNGDRRCELAAYSRPMTACPALPFSRGALRIVAANASTGAMSFGPLLTDDSNGENARSVVGALEHGAFRYLFAGDLTGGGSDTDAVEAFLAPEIEAADVVHLSHHARDTSSSTAWLDRALPIDGRPRTAVAGISLAHVGSPHASVVRAVTPRLGGASLFVTRVAPGGAAQDVVDGRGGSIRVLTVEGGARYRVQALDEAGVVVRTEETTSARGCTP